jgi:hypothetical protein
MHVIAMLILRNTHDIGLARSACPIPQHLCQP